MTSTLCSSILPLTPHPARISILGSDCHTPFHHPLEFQKLSYLVETPQAPGRNISDKSTVALYYYAKDNCLCDKSAEKNHFIHVNEVSNNLNFQLRVVTKNINVEAMMLAYLHILSHKT